MRIFYCQSKPFSFRAFSGAFIYQNTETMFDTIFFVMGQRSSFRVINSHNYVCIFLKIFDAKTGAKIINNYQELQL